MRIRWAAALFALLLFCCGVAVGVLADRYYDTETVAAKTTPESFRKRYISHMRSRLNLTDAQVAKLGKILDGTKARYHAIREKDRPEVLQIRHEEFENVKSILTARQIPIYEQMVKEHEEHERRKHAKEREKHPGH